LKILVIKFKYLGDVVVSTPMLRALREQFPQAELHVLVAAEAVPLLKNIPWLDKVWGLPRRGGWMQLKKVVPLLGALRAKKFDVSLDFVGNDRGAWTGFVINAKKRWGLVSPRGFLGRSWCYHQVARQPSFHIYEPMRELMILESMGIPTARDIRLEIHANGELEAEAARLMPAGAVLCHVSSAQLKKEWPVECWRKLSIKAAQKGLKIVFSAGISEREQAALQSLDNRELGIGCLPPIYDLELFLAVLKRAELFVSGDTGPLHFAVGLQVPTVSLFAASNHKRWAAKSDRHLVIRGKRCQCARRLHVCSVAYPCMKTILPEKVLESIERLLYAKVP
jgi:ADP-heptose:LPS heptosyltransferase